MPPILRLYAPRGSDRLSAVPAGAAPAEDDTLRGVQEWLRGRALFRALATQPEPDWWQQHWWLRNLLAPSASGRNRALARQLLLRLADLTGDPEARSEALGVRFPTVAP